MLAVMSQSCLTKSSIKDLQTTTKKLTRMIEINYLSKLMIKGFTKSLKSSSLRSMCNLLAHFRLLLALQPPKPKALENSNKCPLLSIEKSMFRTKSSGFGPAMSFKASKYKLNWNTNR